MKHFKTLAFLTASTSSLAYFVTPLSGLKGAFAAAAIGLGSAAAAHYGVILGEFLTDKASEKWKAKIPAMAVPIAVGFAAMGMSEYVGLRLSAQFVKPIHATIHAPYEPVVPIQGMQKLPYKGDAPQSNRVPKDILFSI